MGLPLGLVVISTYCCVILSILKFVTWSLHIFRIFKFNLHCNRIISYGDAMEYASEMTVSCIKSFFMFRHSQSKLNIDCFCPMDLARNFISSANITCNKGHPCQVLLATVY